MDNPSHIFKGKSILIISTEAWGEHYVSKHHYAIALANMGNTVYFLNPPEGKNKVSNCGKTSPGLHVVSFNGTSGLRFMPARLARIFQQMDAKKLAALCQTEFDVVWSFDNSRFYNLSVFKRALKIAHVMDLAVDFHTAAHASSADFCFGVTREIVRRMAIHNTNSHFINHGFSPLDFEESRKENTSRKQVGYSGNLLLKFIDRTLVLKLIKSNPQVDFNFYGGYGKSNLSDGVDPKGIAFIEKLQQERNAILHGPLERKDLLQSLKANDILLLFYDANTYQGACHNSHKILEYLSTGNEVLSLPILEYAQSNLIHTASNHLEYLEKFKELLNHQPDPDLHRDRIAYANDHTYIRQIARIQKIIDGE